ncbi:hypothetical protein FPD46_00645 [Campylobacter peloridis]|uniref:Uncharacterized protein n=1 Tax=Campylobacter peloridis TaxID=488546 RepID=A0A5C7E0C8_9BACT|nr:hypothetical protein [Campylobacter peloridis]TXE84777.1 hypothetical protein FPD46_00645 [Campylobacter peloridis]
MEKIIKNIEEHSKIKNDKKYEEFAEQLLLFKKQIEENNKDINLNNPDNFYNKLKEHVEKEFQDDEEYKSFFLNQSGALVLEFKEKGFIDLSNFYTNFSKNYLKDLENTELENEEQIERKKAIDELMELIEQNEDLTEKTENIKEDIAHLNEIENESEEKKRLNAQDMINFINDESQIYFPFDRNETLNNIRFMSNFNSELLKLNTSQINEMIENVKKKNEILEKELNQLMIVKKEKIEELKNEMEKNSNNTLLILNEKDLDSENFQEELKSDGEQEVNQENENQKNQETEDQVQLLEQALAEMENMDKEREQNFQEELKSDEKQEIKKINKKQ